LYIATHLVIVGATILKKSLRLHRFNLDQGEIW